jgi:Ca2+-binding RTX toxin-like protein
MNKYNDEIYSGLGNDTIDAGVGNDTVDAGPGNDTINATITSFEQDIFNGNAGLDTLIVDFSKQIGEGKSLPIIWRGINNLDKLVTVKTR